MKIKLDHINILVEDWDKTIAFYQQLFGFIEGKHVPEGHKNYLYTKDQSQTLIHLTSLKSKELTNSDPNKAHKVQATPGSQNQNTGALDHIAFSISSQDFDQMLEKLNALAINYRITTEQPRQMWFLDPNGIKLELSDKS